MALTPQGMEILQSITDWLFIITIILTVIKIIQMLSGDSGFLGGGGGGWAPSLPSLPNLKKWWPFGKDDEEEDEREGKLLVKVKDESGNPLNDVSVLVDLPIGVMEQFVHHIIEKRLWKEAGKTGETEEGVLLKEHVEEGYYDIKLEKEGYNVDGKSEWRVEVHDGKTTTIEAVMIPLDIEKGSIQVKVVDDKGPVSGAIVHKAPNWVKKIKGLRALGDEKVTDDEGKCTFKNLKSGIHYFFAEARKYEKSEVKEVILEESGQELTIELEKEKTGNVMVYVQDQNSNPIKNAKVKVKGSWFSDEKTDDKGRIYIQNISLGKTIFKAKKKNHESKEVEHEVVEGKSKVIIELEREEVGIGNIEITVKDIKTGEKLEDAKVSIVKKRWRGTPKKLKTYPTKGGVWKFKGIRAGESHFVATAPGYGESEVYTFEIKEDELNKFEIKLEEPLSKIAIKVVDSIEREGIAEAEINIEKKKGLFRKEERTEKTGKNGTFVDDEIWPGDYTLTISKKGFKEKEYKFELERGETKKLPVILVPDIYVDIKDIYIEEAGSETIKYEIGVK